MMLVRYGEIALKGLNRSTFEKTLVRNIKKKLKDVLVVRKRGRILVYRSEDESIAQQVFGITSISSAREVDASIESIQEGCKHFFTKIPDGFRITCKRLTKDTELNSQDIERKIGALAVQLTGKKVTLKEPKYTIHIEILDNKAYIFDSITQGLGGLPVGVSGEVACLLSGGIDSPVAAWKIMKRGCTVTYIHFHPVKLSRGKIIDIVTILAQYQGKTKLIFVPAVEIFNEIIKTVPEELRVLFFRNLMFAFTEYLGYKAIVTGDNLAQVSSQTLENIAAAQQGISIPILRPLLCEDKVDIIGNATKIKTFDLSLQAYDDCCTLIVSKHPQTKAHKDIISKYPIDQTLLFEKIYKNKEVIFVND